MRMRMVAALDAAADLGDDAVVILATSTPTDMRHALLLALPFALACDSITAPDRELAARDVASRIRFVVDNQSCQGMVSLDVVIDKRAMGSQLVIAGDSVEYKTSPGKHDVSVRGSYEAFGAIGAWQTLQVAAPVRVVLAC